MSGSHCLRTKDDRRVALAMDGALQMKKINKNEAIVSEATSRISAGLQAKLLLVMARL